MSAVSFMNQNDTTPDMTGTCLDGDGAAVDLSGSTLLFHMRRKGTATPKINSAASIVIAASGTWKYEWLAGDTDTVGEFEFQLQVTFGGGDIRTFPNDGYNRLIVTEQIA